MVWKREISTKVEQGQSMDSQLVRAVTQRLPFKVYVKTRWSGPYSVDLKKSCKCKNKGPIQGSFMTWSVLQMWSNKKGHRAQIKTCRQNQKKSSTFTGAWPHTVLYNISLLEIKKTKRLGYMHHVVQQTWLLPSFGPTDKQERISMPIRGTWLHLRFTG